MLGCCASPSFLARTSHVNVSASSLALVCVDPEDPDETRRECLLRRLNRCIKLAEDMGLAVGNFQLCWMIRLPGRGFLLRKSAREYFYRRINFADANIIFDHYRTTLLFRLALLILAFL